MKRDFSQFIRLLAGGTQFTLANHDYLNFKALCLAACDQDAQFREEVETNLGEFIATRLGRQVGSGVVEAK